MKINWSENLWYGLVFFSLQIPNNFNNSSRANETKTPPFWGFKSWFKSGKGRWQCIGFDDYLWFGQIMKNKKCVSKSKKFNKFQIKSFKKCVKSKSFLKNPNSNQIQIQSKSNPKNNK